MVAKPHNLTADKADITLIQDSESVIASLDALTSGGVDADEPPCCSLYIVNSYETEEEE